MSNDATIIFAFRSRQWGWLSNFSPYPFVLDGVSWPTVEHFYQAQKSLYAGERERIRAARHGPAEACS
jgi:predicted NAD-dependent protein-ADP-ribosyltransferase YbiA (DUF1768 family)